MTKYDQYSKHEEKALACDCGQPVLGYTYKGKRYCYSCLQDAYARESDNITPEGIAKGLLYLKKHFPNLYTKAKKHIPTELLQAARDSYKTVVSINEQGEIEK